jgi:hypothetical protein
VGLYQALIHTPSNRIRRSPLPQANEVQKDFLAQLNKATRVKTVDDY